MRSLRKRKLFARLLLVSFGAALVATFGLVELHDEILKSTFAQHDRAVQAWVHTFTGPGLTHVMKTLTTIGSPFFVATAVVLAMAALWWKKYKDDAVLVAASALGAVLLDEVMKLHFKRLRPDVPWAFVHEHSFSFPSGHSVLAFVMYGVIVYKTQDKLHSNWLKAVESFLALLMVLGIGLSRVYLGVHYPSDVAGGYFVGAVWLAAVIGSDLWVQKQRL